MLRLGLILLFSRVARVTILEGVEMCVKPVSKMPVSCIASLSNTGIHCICSDLALTDNSATHL